MPINVCVCICLAIAEAGHMDKVKISYREYKAAARGTWLPDLTSSSMIIAGQATDYSH